MKSTRCPYHVKQGVVAENGDLVLRDICGVKSASGESCPMAPFEGCSFTTCPRFVAYQRGSERQVLIPRNDMEYRPEFGGLNGFSEMELM